MTPADQTAAARAAGGRAAFRYPEFTRFFIARLLSGSAMQIHNVGVGWLIYDLTHSALALGLVGLTAFLPAVLLALIAGHVADRFDRRRIIVAAYAVIALSASGLAWYAAMGLSNPLPVYAIVLCIGTARAFANPATQALLPNIVPRSHFGNAITWNSSAWQTASIAGPAIGGLLYAIAPVVAFATTALGFLAACMLIASIAPRPPAAFRTKLDWLTLVGGLAFIRRQPVILGATTLDLFAVLLGGATAMLPIYADTILQVGPVGLGVLRSMPAWGAVTMALVLAYRPLTRRSGLRMFQAVALFGVATVVFGLSSNLVVTLIALFVLGASDMVSVYVRQTLVQTLTPDELRGRVAAVNSLFVGASNELGEFESGALASVIGVVAAVVTGGVGTIAIAAIWTRLFPELLARDRLIE